MSGLPITREEAIDLLKSMPQLDSDMNHYLETEAIMRALAERFGEDVEYWGMLGLLHDVDWALTRNDWKEHCTKAVEILRAKGFDDTFIENLQSHGYGYDEIPALKDKKKELKDTVCPHSCRNPDWDYLCIRIDEREKDLGYGSQRSEEKVQ
jgi:putative nucleotidyltransferase with HDIG domain